MEVEMILLNLTDKNTGKCPDRGDGGGGNGDNPGGGSSGGRGRGGGEPNPQGHDDPANPRALSDKLIGKGPKIFEGDQNKVKEFMTSWSIYRGINKYTMAMDNPMQQTMLFFGYTEAQRCIYGERRYQPNLTDIFKVGDKIQTNGSGTMINDFTQNFQDIMSQERAQKQLFELWMERWELDDYTAKYQQLCELAGYHRLTGMICNQYFQGLPKGLQEAMIGFEPVKHYHTLSDWIDVAIRQHSKYLSYQAYFRPKKNNQKFLNNEHPSKQQWQQGFAKNPNAMDLTPGHTCARAALTDDERATLCQEEKCFKCWKKGHMSWDCPNQTSQVQSGQTKEESPSGEVPETKDPEIKQITAQELVNLVHKMEQGEKDKVIQEVFMKEDFWRALTWWPGEEPFIHSNVTLCILLTIKVWKSLFHFKLHMQGPTKTSW